MPPLRVWALVSVLAFAGCANHAQADAQSSPSPAPRVDTVVARDGTIRPTLLIAGVVTPYRQVGVSSSLSEPIVDVDVREGDRVHSGQVLARLETDDLQAQLASAQQVAAENQARYAQTAYSTQATVAQNSTDVRSARAALAQADVNYSGAEADLQRDLRLAADGYLPQQTLDQQRTTVASDREAVAAARASLSAALANAAANGNGQSQGAQQAQIAAARAAVDAAAASVTQLRRQIARAVIAAPADGVVQAVNANPGEYPQGRQLFTISQNATMYAVLPASSSQAVRIQPGARATISISGGEHTPAVSGRVEAVLDQIQPGTTNFIVKVLVDNSAQRLHAGMPVRALVELPGVSGIVIPVSAFADDDRASVYVVRDGIVRRVTVRERADDGTRAVVTGLPADSRAVANAQTTTVAEGDHVRT